MRRFAIARNASILFFGAALIIGCAQAGPSTPLHAPIAAAATPPADSGEGDWNIFPDPITGRVEIYRDGAHVGSVTGEENEEPPVPRPRQSIGTDTN